MIILYMYPACNEQWKVVSTSLFKNCYLYGISYASNTNVMMYIDQIRVVNFSIFSSLPFKHSFTCYLQHMHRFFWALSSHWSTELENSSPLPVLLPISQSPTNPPHFQTSSNHCCSFRWNFWHAHFKENKDCFVFLHLTYLFHLI